MPGTPRRSDLDGGRLLGIALADGLLDGEDVAVDEVLGDDAVADVVVVVVVGIVVVVVVGAGEETACGSVVPGLPLPNPIK